MKLKLMILGVVILAFCAGQIFAHEGMKHDEQMEEKGSMMGHSEAVPEEDKGSMMEDMDEHHSENLNVGNAICPVSGEFISDVGDGKGVQIEHEDKIYNVCCKFCAKDFRKDPEKFITIIENNLAEGKDSGRVYESDHDEDLEHDEGDHEDSDHGEHDHSEEAPQEDEGDHQDDHGDHDH